MLRQACLCACLCLLLLSAKAQEHCSISAELILEEAHTHVPVADVWLQLPELNLSAQTDENGIVHFDSLCAGIYQVHVHSYLVQDTTISVKVTEGAGSIHLHIPHSAHQLNQVLVLDKQEKGLLQAQSKLDSRALQANSGDNLGNLLKNVNGLSSLNNGATIVKPMIHGLHSNRILILNNEVRQEDQQWGAEHAPNIDPFAAQEITVLKGAAGVRYGSDAIAGVILVSPGPIRSENGWGGRVNIAAVSNNRQGVANVMLEHRFKKMPELGFRVQASALQGGNYRIPGNIYVANTGLREHNLSLALQYKKVHSGTELYYSYFQNTLGLYRGSHTGSQQDLYNAIHSSTPLYPANFTYDIGRPKQEVLHQLLKFKTYREGRWGLLQLIYAYQNNYRQEYDVIRTSSTDAQLHLRLQTHSLNLNWDMPVWHRLKTQIGIDGTYQHNTFRNGDRVFIPSYYTPGGAVYAISRLTLGNYLLEAGLRYDYKHFEMYNPEGNTLANVRYLFDYRNPSATLAVKRSWSKNWETMLTLSNAWRAPQANELFSAGYHQGGARIELGDKNLKPEQALSAHADIHFHLRDKWDVQLLAYTQHIDHFIYLNPGEDILTIRGYFKTFQYTQTNALLSGFDFDARYHLNEHWQAHFKAAIIRAWDRSQKDWLILMPADRMSIDLNYHFKLTRFAEDCFVGAESSWVAQQRRIPADFDQIDYPRPPAAYHLLQVETGSKVRLGKQQFEWRFSVNNLLNERYRDYLDVFRYFVDKPGRNFTLRLNYIF